MKSPRFYAYLGVTLAVLAWGGSFIATKLAVGQVSPVTVIWLRFGIGVIILGLAARLRGQLAWPKRNDLAYFGLLGLIGIALHQWLQATGLETSQASTTAWIVASTPVFMALLGWLALKERLAALQIAGIALAACGVLVVVTQGDLMQLLQGRFGKPGDFLILLSAPNWAVFSALSRRGLQRFKATQMMFYVMTSGWLLTTIFMFSGAGFEEIALLNRDGWVGVLFLGVACSGIAYIGWYDALQVLPASQAGAFIYLEPLVTVIVSAVVLSEPVSLASLLGGGTILVGVWLVNRFPQRKLALSEERSE